MKNNSWVKLPKDHETYVLTPKLREADPFDGVDIGWVSQMQEFIRDFTSTGDWILDPFSGLGTTLIAAEAEQRNAVGIELESERVLLTKKRWEHLGFQEDRLIQYQGDCVQKLIELGEGKALPPFQLLITSIPYFGGELASNRSYGKTNHLYQERDYEEFLNYFKRLFFIAQKHLKSDGTVVLMAENIRDENQCLLPLAWDIQKIMSRYFCCYDERVIVYEKSPEQLEVDIPVSNRAHEYALIAKPDTTPLNTESALRLLRKLANEEVNFVVYGGFREVLKGERTQTQDVDLILPCSAQSKTLVFSVLLSLGYDIQSYSELVSEVSLTGDNKLEAQPGYYRCRGGASVRQIDLVFVLEEAFTSIAQIDLGVPCSKDSLVVSNEWGVYMLDN